MYTSMYVCMYAYMTVWANMYMYVFKTVQITSIKKNQNKIYPAHAIHQSIKQKKKKKKKKEKRKKKPKILTK